MLTTLDDINEFTLSCEAGKYLVWAELDNNAHTMVMYTLVDSWNAFVVRTTSRCSLNMYKNQIHYHKH